MTSDDQIRCGIKILHTGPNDPFIHECAIHDGRYAQGGSVEMMTAADKAFYAGMFRKALKRPWLLPRATLYTFFVMLGGRWVWDKLPEEGVVTEKPSMTLVSKAVASRALPKVFGVPVPVKPFDERDFH